MAYSGTTGAVTGSTTPAASTSTLPANVSEPATVQVSIPSSHAAYPASSSSLAFQQSVVLALEAPAAAAGDAACPRTRRPRMAAADPEGSFQGTPIQMPPQQNVQATSPPPVAAATGFESQPTAAVYSMAQGSGLLRTRGRQYGSSGRRPQPDVQESGSSGSKLTASFLYVKPGEDISAKILDFFKNSNATGISVLSATGIISRVTVNQAASGRTATFEGWFDILCLSGSFSMADAGGQRSMIGGLSITWAGPENRFYGGCVAGPLIAGSPVQIVIGSFAADGGRPISTDGVEPPPPPPPAQAYPPSGFGASSSSQPFGTPLGGSSSNYGSSIFNRYGNPYMR
ncbi:OLC1v1016142C1 [Oldenlandia corymbosa var. corymbosa]|uniref:AT-hook motif nuclear-localized protein n=1 Tax=Oldenlandia corymbosa var. corymbosa TaxID=529605 RepID=A0AAV1E4R9_OLDCO|nr:OLC1v1016142C1 [Oldenlandia corymbosa var. corymbosa]